MKFHRFRGLRRHDFVPTGRSNAETLAGTYEGACQHTRCALLVMEHRTRSALPEGRSLPLDTGTVSATGDTSCESVVRVPTGRAAFWIHRLTQGRHNPAARASAFLRWGEIHLLVEGMPHREVDHLAGASARSDCDMHLEGHFIAL